MPHGCLAPGRSRLLRTPSVVTLLNALVVGAVLVLNLAQQPGKITFDTKLDLQFDAEGFLARSLSLWNPDWAIGGLQNQASGYLFPMGPAFALGDELGVPMWVWQRLWSAAVMLLAYEGARRLAASWPGVSRLAAVVAGLAYMLSPRVLTTVGGLSGETLPAAVLPWTVLPLVLYLRGQLGRTSALVLSAATIPFMGGQNATLVVACLLFPALLVAFSSGRSMRRRLTDTVLWAALVVLATLWWLVPLVMLGAYAPPFLDFIESAQNTAGSTGWLSSLRGTSHWVAFFPDGGGIGWRGGYELAASRALVVTTVLVAALGLVGLLQRELWQRRVLVVAAMVGLAVLTAGSGGLAGSVLADSWLVALDTFLAPLRNIHKFDPVVRLPLCLGLAAFVTSGVPRSWRPTRVTRPLAARPLLAFLAVAAVLAAAQPAASGALRTTGGMEDIPSSWRGAVDFLRDEPGPVRIMVLPGSGFATQSWGRTVDEPIQVLDPPPWLARAQVTVAPASSLRLVDSIERAVAQGRPDAGLAAAVRRMGITHIVVRNDLARDETDAPPPDDVHASVEGLEGARLVAGFGRRTNGRSAVEVFAMSNRAEPRAALMDWSERVELSGGPEVVGELVAAGLMEQDQAAVLVSGDETADVVTDTNRRVERSFGRVHSAVSAVMTASEEFRNDRQRHDFTEQRTATSQTVAEYDGASGIVASSSGGYADVLGPVRPEQHPFAAFDQSMFTAWASAPLSDPEGQWLEVRFGQAVTPGPVGLQFDTSSGAAVTSVRLTTDKGSVTVDVGPDGRATAITLPEGATTRLRMTVVGAEGDRQVRLTNFSIDGHRISRTLRLPGEVTEATSIFLSSEQPRRGCATTTGGVSCEQARQLETPETPGFTRTITVAESGRWRLSGSALATHGPATEQLLAPLSADLVTVAGSSTFAGDPAVAAANAFDGRPETGWYASPLERSPSLLLTWAKPRRITEVRALLEGSQPGTLPEALGVDPMTGDPTQLVATTGEAAGELQPVRTNRLRITAFAAPDGDGVGISELVIPGLEDLRYSAADDAATGTACGFGPQVQVNGQSVQTRIAGSLSDVRTGRTLAVVACEGEDVVLGPGTHQVHVTNPPGFAVANLTLEPTASTSGTAQAPPAARVQSWSPTLRTITVEADREAVLALSESANAGWSARLGDRELAPVSVDGWRQAWRVPAGTDGVVELRYEPQSAFRIAVVVGLTLATLVGVAGLVLLIRLVVRRRRSSAVQPHRDTADVARATDKEPRGRWPGLRYVGATVLALVSIPLALGAVVGYLTRARATAVVGGACVLALVVASLVAVLGDGSVVVPPEASDVLATLVVGVVSGRVLSEVA